MRSQKKISDLQKDIIKKYNFIRQYIYKSVYLKSVYDYTEKISIKNIINKMN